MDNESLKNYEHIRDGGRGYYRQQRGLIAVWGKEAVQFLDGLITNDMKTLADGAQMLAAFPNAQGRLLAVVRVLRQGERFLFETEELTRGKVFQNLFRFTFAGDFFVEDLSDGYKYFEIYGDKSVPPTVAGGVVFHSATTIGHFIEKNLAKQVCDVLVEAGAVEISDELYEILRIESGIPKYGVDMDETTIVPEIGLDRVISYNKGCYIGQEIIARIHFRGHVAKRLTGLASESGQIGIAIGLSAGNQLTTSDGKNAGRITSVKYSPRIEKTVALAYVRYDYLAEGTELLAGDTKAVVTDLPFIK